MVANSTGSHSRSKHFCTVGKSVSIQCILLAITLCYCAPHIFELEQFTCMHPTLNVTVLRLKPSSLSECLR